MGIFNQSANSKHLVSSLDKGTHSTNWSGIWASSQSGNIDYQVLGNSVKLFFTEVSAAVNSNGSISMVSLLPASLIPISRETCLIIVEDNSIYKIGSAIIDTDGSITIYSDLSNGDFTNSNNAGFKKQTIVYNLT